MNSHLSKLLTQSAFIAVLAMAQTSYANVSTITAKNQCWHSNGECHEINGVITQNDLSVVKVIADRIVKNRTGTSLFRLNSKGGDIDASNG